MCIRDRFIAEQELKENTRFVPLCENHEGKQFTQKIAVIGAGPAGMSAAYYLRTKGYPVTIFEKESRAGGMLMNGIPSFRLEKSVIEAEIDILKQMGIEFRYNVEIGKDITIPELRAQGYQAFYIAIGAQGGRKTGIPGEDAKGVTTGVEFLRSVNPVSYTHLDVYKRQLIYSVSNTCFSELFTKFCILSLSLIHISFSSTAFFMTLSARFGVIM